MVPSSVQTEVVGVAEVGQTVAEYIDHNHPKLGARLMKLRWAGLRTVEHGRWWWAATIGGGVLGAGTVRTLRSRAAVAARLGAAAELAAGLGAGAATSVAIWRWDAARWRRRHVRIRSELPTELLDELVADLAGHGFEVQRWDGRGLVDGARRGLVCRLRDLRGVHARIDEFERSRARGTQGSSGATVEVVVAEENSATRSRH